MPQAIYGCSVIGKLLIMLQFQEIIIYDINGREGGEFWNKVQNVTYVTKAEGAGLALLCCWCTDFCSLPYTRWLLTYVYVAFPSD